MLIVMDDVADDPSFLGQVNYLIGSIYAGDIPKSKVSSQHRSLQRYAPYSELTLTHYMFLDYATIKI